MNPFHHAVTENSRGETTKGTKDYEGADDHCPQPLVSFVFFVVSFGFLRDSVSPW